LSSAISAALSASSSSTGVSMVDTKGPNSNRAGTPGRKPSPIGYLKA
jgi:hypothetical protein